MDMDFTYYYSSSGTTIEIACYYVNNTNNKTVPLPQSVSSSKDVKLHILHILIMCVLAHACTMGLSI